MTLTPLFFSLVTTAVYFIIAYMVMYLIGWGIIQVLHPVRRIINYGRSY